MISSELSDSKRLLGRLLVAGLICFFLGINLAVPAVMDAQNEYLQGVVVGICVGELNLIATWAALATGNLLLRLPWALLLGVLMWHSLILGTRLSQMPSMAAGDAIVLGLVLLAGVVCAQIPLWIAGKVFRWKLIRGPSSEDNHQFSLRQLLAGIFLLSVALGAGRIALPPGSAGDAYFEGELWIGILTLAFFNVVITLPCIWGSFAKPSLLLALAIGWIVYCALLTALEFGVLCAFLGMPGDGEIAFIFYVMNLAQCATVFGVLLLLRAVGFRFVQVPLPTRGSEVGQPP